MQRNTTNTTDTKYYKCTCTHVRIREDKETKMQTTMRTTTPTTNCIYIRACTSTPAHQRTRTQCQCSKHVCDTLTRNRSDFEFCGHGTHVNTELPPWPPNSCCFTLFGFKMLITVSFNRSMTLPCLPLTSAMQCVLGSQSKRV